MLKINGKEVKTNGFFAMNEVDYYILEDETDMNAVDAEMYYIYPIDQLEKKWEEFGGYYASISNWKLTEGYVGQASMRENERTSETDYFREDVIFEGFEKSNLKQITTFMNERFKKIKSDVPYTTKFDLGNMYVASVVEINKVECYVKVYYKEHGKTAESFDTKKQPLDFIIEQIEEKSKMGDESDN